MPRPTPSTYTVAQAAQVLGRTPKRVRQLIANGTLTVVPDSSPQQIPADQVNERRKAQRAGPSTPGPRSQSMTVDQLVAFAQSILDRERDQHRELITAERAALDAAQARVEQLLRAELDRERAERMTAQAQAADLRRELDQLQARTAPTLRWWQRSH